MLRPYSSELDRNKIVDTFRLRNVSHTRSRIAADIQRRRRKKMSEAKSYGTKLNSHEKTDMKRAESPVSLLFFFFLFLRFVQGESVIVVIRYNPHDDVVKKKEKKEQTQILIQICAISLSHLLLLLLSNWSFLLSTINHKTTSFIHFIHLTDGGEYLSDIWLKSLYMLVYTVAYNLW